MGVACSTHGEDVKCIQVLSANPERNRLLGIPRLKWEDNIKIDHR
jgi:hypothetical protein